MAVTTLNHPLVGNYLSLLRDKSSSPEVFRAQVKRLGHMLAIDMSKDLHVKFQEINTPICKTKEKTVSDSISIVPILRAGVGLVEPFLDFMPQAKVMCLGMYRNENTRQPVSYYNKLKDTQPTDVAFIIDPMLATGGSALMAINEIKAWGVKTIKFAALIGSPEGVKSIQAEHSDVDIHLAALDDGLNDDAYIVPGLGDAGDRIFNT